MVQEDQKSVLQFRLRGCLDDRWLTYFKGFKIQHHCEQESLLTGEIDGQDELYEIINKIRDIGIPLISIERLEGDQECCQDEQK